MTSNSLFISGLENHDHLKENLRANCIPESIMDMSADNYHDFLLERRQLMAMKIRDYYFGL
jgi:hypothetical protein